MTSQYVNSGIRPEVRTAYFTEMVLIPVTRAVPKWIPQAAKIRSWLRSLAFQAAISRAYDSFARRYPRWVDSFFDEYFVRHVAAPRLKRCMQRATLPAPVELARLWADQFPPNHPAERYITELTPVAADFLDRLETQLHYPLFQKL